MSNNNNNNFKMLKIILAITLFVFIICINAFICFTKQMFNNYFIEFLAQICVLVLVLIILFILEKSDSDKNKKWYKMVNIFVVGTIAISSFIYVAEFFNLAAYLKFCTVKGEIDFSCIADIITVIYSSFISVLFFKQTNVIQNQNIKENEKNQKEQNQFRKLDKLDQEKRERAMFADSIIETVGEIIGIYNEGKIMHTYTDLKHWQESKKNYKVTIFATDKEKIDVNDDNKTIKIYTKKINVVQFVKYLNIAIAKLYDIRIADELLKELQKINDGITRKGEIITENSVVNLQRMVRNFKTNYVKQIEDRINELENEFNINQ